MDCGGLTPLWPRSGHLLFGSSRRRKSRDRGNSVSHGPGAEEPAVRRAKRRQSAAIDIGRPLRAFPVTPPGVRVRTRRFGGLWRTPSGNPRQAEGPCGGHLAFGVPARRERFGLSGRRRRGFTLSHRTGDQRTRAVAFTAAWAHERRVLLATPFDPLRGPFGPSSAPRTDYYARC